MSHLTVPTIVPFCDVLRLNPGPLTCKTSYLNPTPFCSERMKEPGVVTHAGIQLLGGRGRKEDSLEVKAIWYTRQGPDSKTNKQPEARKGDVHTDHKMRPRMGVMP